MKLAENAACAAIALLSPWTYSTMLVACLCGFTTMDPLRLALALSVCLYLGWAATLSISGARMYLASPLPGALTAGISIYLVAAGYPYYAPGLPRPPVLIALALCLLLYASIAIVGFVISALWLRKVA